MPTTIRLSEPLPGVAVVTFARPEAANALSTLMGEELLLACDFAYAADTARFGLPEVASEIAAKAPLSVRALKHVVREAHSLDLAAAMEMELSAYNRLFKTQDRREGVASFNEKRRPVFRGK